MGTKYNMVGVPGVTCAGADMAQGTPNHVLLMHSTVRGRNNFQKQNKIYFSKMDKTEGRRFSEKEHASRRSRRRGRRKRGLPLRRVACFLWLVSYTLAIIVYCCARYRTANKKQGKKGKVGIIWKTINFGGRCTEVSVECSFSSKCSIQACAGPPGVLDCRHFE